MVGPSKDWLSHTVALEVEPYGVRECIGAGHSFKWATEYVDAAHPM